MGPKQRHNVFHKITSCFEWPQISACLQQLTLWPLYSLYLLYSIFMMNEWYLYSSLASVPNMIFLDIYQWIRFVICFCLCLSSKWLAYLCLTSLWIYKFFLSIIKDPDKIYKNKYKSSYRKINRYCKRGYSPIRAYSKKFVILSCYQLHEYIDNGYCELHRWLQEKHANIEKNIVRYLFEIQSYFFPQIPTEGPILEAFSFTIWTLVTATLCFLCIVTKFSVFIKHMVLSTHNLLARSFSQYSSTISTIWNLSPFSSDSPKIMNFDSDQVYLTENECIKRCYESETTSHSKYFSFFSAKCETVYVDNCANCHITNDKEHFISYTPYDNIQDATSVNTIGGDTKPIGEGTVRWSWRDDTGKSCRFDLPGCKFYPNSSVCILSQTQLGIFLKDSDFGTKIESGIRTSHFYWNNQKHCRTIHHTPSFMPKMVINDDISPLASIYATFRDFFDDNASYSMLTESELSLDFDKLVGKSVRYSKGDFKSKAIVLSVSAEKVFTIQLDDGSQIDTHHNFITLLPIEASSSQKPLPRSLAETISHRLQNEPELGLPKTKEKLSDEQKELLRWHIRLGHISFKTLHIFAQLGLIPKHLAKVSVLPLCASCTVANARRRPWRTNSKPSTIRKSDHDFPGGCVSVDQIVSGQTGMVPQTRGHRTLDRFVGATVFVDNFSSFVYIHMMRSLSADETMDAKFAFERVAHDYGVKIMNYRADNGRFADKRFRDDCELKKQGLTFCGVGAHHQNGVAERMIQTMTTAARAMLVHALSVWPEAITIALWPYALFHACDRHNRLHLDKLGYTPLERFSRTRSPIRPDIFHSWGSPIYVLDARNQSGTCSVPKWEPRSRLGIYLGFSPCHSSDVALVMSPSTGNLSPQFHVVFDDEFSTLPFLRQQKEPPHWSTLVNQSRYLATDQEFELSNEWETIPAPKLHEPRIPEYEGDRTTTPQPKTDDSASTQHVLPKSEGDKLPEEPSSSAEPNKNKIPAEPDTETELGMPAFVDPNSIGLRRSERTPKPRRIFTFASFYTMTEAFSTCQNTSSINSETVIDGTLNYINPVHQVFSSKTDNETYTYREMMKQDDFRDFIKAMVIEIDEHTKRKHWVLRRRADCNFPKTILAVWSFKRKRFPDGSLSKHKARLCAHGGMQQWGIHYWETFAPVVNWLSVRLVLVLAIIYDLPVKSIDFVLAFPQSELDVPIYMELPVGFDVQTGQRGEYVIQLKKSLYGLKQSGLNWYEKLKNGLIKRNLVPSKVDPCVFIGEKVIVLTYVDDCIIMGKTEADIKDLFKSLQDGNENYDFTDEGDLKNYLGVEFTRHPDGRIEIKQEYLIERIIKSLGLKDELNGKHTNPGIKPSLHKDETGPSRKHQWHYRSVIGMLNYLEKTSRPEIAYAVHQCARFCNAPKLSHERAVHRIVRYLTTTRDKGMIFKPDKDKGIICHVDADFAGNWNLVEGDNPASVLSRTGFVITYANCPLIWASKLQTEIALSTTEAEYIALSQAMKEIIPLINILGEIKRHYKVIDDLPEIHCQLFEDNKSALALAKAPQMNPRTKYISLKYHHFRSYVSNKLVTILPISTEEQTADIFTKVLPDPKFFYLRKKLCGY